jgi:hypothetical protein
VAWLLLVSLSATGACAGGGRFHRFPDQDPMRVDAQDFRPFTPKPEEYVSSFAWDGADYMLFRPLARAWLFEPVEEAVNVNAMDEVPDSSWYENRLGHVDLSLAELQTGPCREPPPDPDAGFSVVAGKPNGANPGFIVETPDDRRFLLKFDGTQGERATAADVIGSLIYWAHGYHTPCNRVVWFQRERLTLADGAEATIDGQDVAMTEAMLEPVFRNAVRSEAGLFRATASRFLTGEPLGPWRYEGTRDDDPNDVIPHEDRRELRGSYVLAAFINHFDSREQNTLAVWREKGASGGYVQHTVIDFGDSFGSLWDIEGISRRLGHSSYFDVGHVVADFATLGTVPRPWHEAQAGRPDPVLGYFGVKRFDPDGYHPGYPNPAFDEATERDKAWMARKLARMTPRRLEAVVAMGRLESQRVERKLLRILRGRRKPLLERYLRYLSPLTRPELIPIDGVEHVCLDDLAVTGGLISGSERPYWVRAYAQDRGSRFARLSDPALVRVAKDRVCAAVPGAGASAAEGPRYVVMDVLGLYGADDTEARPARVHLRVDGPTRIVGLERPYTLAAPEGLRGDAGAPAARKR